MDPIAVGNWLRDANDNAMNDFIERLMSRLSDRELKAIKWARKDMASKLRDREAAMERHRMAEANRKRKQEEAERPYRLAREFEAVCATAFSS